jgi:hypothetical protein
MPAPCQIPEKLPAAPDCAMSHIAIAESFDGRAVDWMERSDVRYRFVIDMASLPVPAAAIKEDRG